MTDELKTRIGRIARVANIGAMKENGWTPHF